MGDGAMSAGGICSDRVTAAEDPPWGEPIAQREIYGYCPPVRPVNATSASPSGPGSTSASAPTAAAAAEMTAARTGGGGEQPAPMGWGAQGLHGPHGLVGRRPWWRWRSRGKVRNGGEEREQLGFGTRLLYCVSTIVIVRSWMDG